MSLLRFSNFEVYREFFDSNSGLFEGRWLWGQRLRQVTANSGRVEGWCGLCEAPSSFTYGGSTDDEINLREDLHCARCELNARNRAALALLRECLPDAQAPVYATEQASPAFRWLRAHYPNAIGSEYFDDTSADRLQAYLRSLFDQDAQLRFEDATSLSFDDARFDALLTCDVLEHIPDYRAALAEFARVLKPGGHLILTVPFIDSQAQSILRAEIDEDGNTIHHVEPEYHGDPVSPHGVLAYHTFAWDLLDAVRDAGFANAEWCLPWRPDRGLFGTLWMLHAGR
ncbi:MAG: class I SAM-dependent methyltransferase [Wenzhouxiangellaceae bacterium]|nr:class I SAM-dependent methyltransferase [Wenzhouxiangellaceae bacterium]